MDVRYDRVHAVAGLLHCCKRGETIAESEKKLVIEVHDRRGFEYERIRSWA